MRARKTPTRLDVHRLLYHWLGRKTSLLQFDSLDEEEKKTISNAVFTNMYLNRDADKYAVYAETLSDWGVMCPHPQHMRVYPDGSSSHFHDFSQRWFSCRVCNCTVFTDRDCHENSKKLGT